MKKRHAYLLSSLLAFSIIFGTATSLFINKEVDVVYADTTSINHVIGLIDGIGSPSLVEYTQEYKESIDEAVEAYNALSDDDKGQVSNYDTLLAIIARYEELRYVDVHLVEDRINAIGSVSYSSESKAKIHLALNAYNRLDIYQKPLVSNYNVLETASNIYNHVDEAANKIAAIGEVTLDSGLLIMDARDTYDSLTEIEKSLIPTYYEELVLKEDTYKKLVHDYKVRITCAIVFGILGGLILLITGSWLLMMFVFNKWINKDGKVLRACKLFGIKKNGKPIVLIFPVRFELRKDSELFASKEAALK